MLQKPSELEPLAKAIHDQVFRQFFDFKKAVFLCGAGTKEKNSVRGEIDKQLRDWRFSYRYDLVYPEELFDELLFGENHQDLLTLENILAESVDAIVLVVESYGAVAELGIFASSEELRKKLVCVIDRQYKTTKSFINYGPLRLLKDKGEGEIIYGNYSNVPKMIEPIRRGISKVSKVSTKSTSVNNVLQAHHYILPCVFLLEPVPRRTLINLVMYASGISEVQATAITAGALKMLSKNREIVLTAEGFRLTNAGRQKFSALGKRGWRRNTYDISALDELRISIMSWKYRKKPLEISWA